MSIPYKQFKIRHPEYDAEYWRICRLLYSGKKMREALENDSELAKRLFPRHNAEELTTYRDRLSRSFYVPHAGQIIDFLVSALFTAGVSMVSEPEEHDPFYDIFYTDVSPQGSSRMTVNNLLWQSAQTALICQRAWTLVDLPTAEEATETPVSLADEEAKGLRRAYAIPMPPECVIDWEEDDKKDLLWALCRCVKSERQGLTGARDKIVEEFTYYDRERWQRYAIEYKIDRNGNAQVPRDNAPVELIEEGKHSFGKVPLVPLDLPDGLYAMGKIESLATEYFNKSCALSWGEYKSLFQFLSITLAPDNPENAATGDPNRGLNQTIGQGRVWVGAQGDKLEYVSPDSEPYRVSMERLRDLRDEMHRVCHILALSQENSAAAMQRSAQSKQVDQVATAIVLGALGGIVREHVTKIYEMVGFGRRDPLITWRAYGLDDFDKISTDALIDEVTRVEMISLPSPAFQKTYKHKLARRLLGSEMTDELDEEIGKDLESHISDEAVSMGMDTDGQAEMATKEAEAQAKAASAPAGQPSKEKK